MTNTLLKHRTITACVLVCLAATAATWEAFAQTAAPPVRRILFVGDSLTYSQGGVDAHLARMAASATPPLMVTAERSTFGGAYLHRLWDRPEPRQAIGTGSYQVVVLQEDLPETTVADFRDYAARFVAEVRKHGARPLLFMAWDYPRLGWISMSEIAQAHRAAAKELSVDVAPVGLAWQRASQQRPALNLYAADREHPSIHGTYLAACVIYGSIYDRDPAGTAYVPAGVTADEAAFLQSVAWQVVRDYRAGRI